jgi:polar amino acid transport system substrate-binding protein
MAKEASFFHLFMSIAIVALLVGCSKNSSAIHEESARAYNRILQTKAIRAAYISYPPSFIKDAKTGEYSGVMYEVLQEVAARLELKVQYVEETAWGTMIEAVRSGRVDLVCTGLWPNATRGKLVDFTDAVYFSPVRAYVKQGNAAFDGDLARINTPNVKIATIDGEMTSIIAKADYAQAVAVAHPQSTDVAQMLLEVASGKAAVTFVEPAVANGFLRNNPGSVSPVKSVEPVRVFPNVLMVAKGETELVNMLNTALEEAANTGVIERIIRKYEAAPGLMLRRQLPYRPMP